MKWLFLTLVCLTIKGSVFGQGVSIDSIQNELLRINQAFDSAKYLGFDLRIEYKSDTLLGDFEYEELSGHYILSDRKVYYKMGGDEYIQTDSFVFHIDYAGQTLAMTKNVVTPGSGLPLKQFLDSVVVWYESRYLMEIQFADSGSLKQIVFTALQSGSPYTSFTISYDDESYLTKKIEMYFEQPQPTEEPEVIQLRKKELVMFFSNYRYETDTDVFSEEKYVIYDHQTNRYRPSAKYRNYRFVSSGVGSEDIDESIELVDPDGN